MIALIKTFALQQTSAVSEQFHGTSSISSSFAVKIDRLPDSPTVAGSSSISSAFAVKIYSLPDSPTVASSFALAHGGYELNGVILDKKLEKTKLIRQR